MIQVLTILNVDGKTTQMEPNGDVKANLVFSDKYKVFPVADITEVCIREPTNANTLSVITGVKVAGKWYGDRPDDGKYINPFTGEELTKGTPIPEFSWDKVSATIEVRSNSSDSGYPPFTSAYNIRFSNGNTQMAQAEIIATVTSGNGTITGGNTPVHPSTSVYSNTMSTPDWGDVPSEYNIKVKVTYNGESRILAETSGTMSASLH